MKNKVGILMPELVIHNILVAIIKMLRKDLNEHEDQDTILYKILGLDEEQQTLQLNIYNYYKQAKKIIQTEHNLSINFGYNQEVAKLLSLHIILPSEQATAAIGEDEGYIEDNDRMYFTQLYECNYQIMITSVNSAEVNVIYNVLKSMLLMLVPQLELLGLRVPHFSGNDIIMQDDLTPVPIFHKVLNIGFKYEHNVPQLLTKNVMNRFYTIYRIIDFHSGEASSPIDNNVTSITQQED
jgi:hypothetical protein